jgi:hypothetical protein
MLFCNIEELALLHQKFYQGLEVAIENKALLPFAKAEVSPSPFLHFPFRELLSRPPEISSYHWWFQNIKITCQTFQQQIYRSSS